MKLNYMAVDQYGQTYHGLGARPRKALLERLGRTSARKMYVDKTDGSAKHIGYIVAGLWLRLFIVQPFERPA